MTDDGPIVIWRRWRPFGPRWLETFVNAAEFWRSRTERNEGSPS